MRKFQILFTRTLLLMLSLILPKAFSFLYRCLQHLHRGTRSQSVGGYSRLLPGIRKRVAQPAVEAVIEPTQLLPPLSLCHFHKSLINVLILFILFLTSMPSVTSQPATVSFICSMLWKDASGIAVNGCSLK